MDHGDDEPGGGKAGIPLALRGLEISGHEHHCGDECAEQSRAGDDRRHFDGELVEEGRDAHKAAAADGDAHKSKDGLEELLRGTAVIIVDLIECDHRHEHGRHDGETSDHAERDFGVIFEPVAAEAVHQKWESTAAAMSSSAVSSASADANKRLIIFVSSVIEFPSCAGNEKPRTYARGVQQKE